MLVENSTVLLSAVFVPTTFATWSAKGPEDAEKICAVYTSFLDANKSNSTEFLQEAEMGKVSEEVTFRPLIEIRDGIPVPHSVPLHGLGPRPCFRTV